MTTQQYPADVSQLLNILTYKRPHGSEGEASFVQHYLTPLNPSIVCSPKGEVLAYVVTTNPESKTLFSCHVDTVHRSSGSQMVAYDPMCQLVYKSQNPDVKDDECLGADDGAGIWLMLQMIAADVSGHYVFHRGEEKGGIGSRGMAEHHAQWLSRFDHAVAFDRRGTQDVITHQAMGRCCSDQFAAALADALNRHPELTYRPDDGGVFTDTANYTHLIPECTNLSCGYEAEHGPSECLDVDHLLKLRDACLHVSWGGLPTVRDPSVVERDTWGGWGWGSSYNTQQFFSKDTEDVMEMTYSQMVKFVKNSNPEDVAEVMFELIDQIYAMQDQMHGVSDTVWDEDSFERRM